MSFALGWYHLVLLPASGHHFGRQRVGFDQNHSEVEPRGSVPDLRGGSERPHDVHLRADLLLGGLVEEAEGTGRGRAGQDKARGKYEGECTYARRDKQQGGAEQQQ